MPRFAFKFISGKYQGGEVPLPDEGELTIGRASDLDLVLVEDMVSRKHAKLVAQHGILSITDLGSTNGTFVNGEKIRRTDIQRNDRVLVGTSILKVIAGSELKEDGIFDREAVRENLERLASRATESATMSGELEEVPLPDLLQLFASNKKSGILAVSGPRRGKLYIRGGQLQFAIIGGEPNMKPMKAICRMVGWDRGAFIMEEWDGKAEFPETFEVSTESILMEALRQHDEMRRLMPEMPPPEANLKLCVPMVPRLADLSPGELDTVQAAHNHAGFKSVVDKSEYTDYEAISNVKKLMASGYLEVQGD